MGRGGQKHGEACREVIATRPKGFHLLWSGEQGQVLRVGVAVLTQGVFLHPVSPRPQQVRTRAADSMEEQRPLHTARESPLPGLGGRLLLWPYLISAKSTTGQCLPKDLRGS